MNLRVRIRLSLLEITLRGDFMSEFKRVIWSDIDLNLDDWRDSLEELYPGYPEDELYEIMPK